MATTETALPKLKRNLEIGAFRGGISKSQTKANVYYFTMEVSFLIRKTFRPRLDWEKQLKNIGFTFYNMPSESGGSYWNEAAGYEFTEAEIETLETITKELFDRCLDAVEYVIQNKRLQEFGIPDSYWQAIVDSWRRDDPTVYGRFDLAYDGSGHPKMLEFNADTPTTLIESAVAQWHWVCDQFGVDADQFNSIHEKLIVQWKHIREERLKVPKGTVLHLASVHSGNDGRLIIEDHDTVAYMAETAQLAGFETKQIFMEQIGWNGEQFVDGDNQPIKHFFKLYPWEWIAHEPFAPYILETAQKSTWIEPLWKMILSNKQLLVILWELFPDHPNLLPTYTNPDAFIGKRYVKKPKLSREGANVQILNEQGVVMEEARGEYGEEGHVYQAFAELPKFDGKHALIGSWIVGDEPAGINMRETSNLITSDLAEFVPHYIAKKGVK